jgi:DNA-nicking Smr family endonuclease
MANKYQQLNLPQAEFDFHDRGPLTSHDILGLADNFILNSLRNNLTIISFIVGKGIHSANGPVIKPLLADFLKNHPDVKSFSEGKFAQGGEGVFIVKLK